MIKFITRWRIVKLQEKLDSCIEFAFQLKQAHEMYGSSYYTDKYLEAMKVACDYKAKIARLTKSLNK